MANIKIESVVFDGLLPIKGFGRTKGQIKPDEARDLNMTLVDGLVLVIDGPAGTQLVPFARVKVAMAAAEQEAEPPAKKGK